MGESLLHRRGTSLIKRCHFGDAKKDELGILKNPQFSFKYHRFQFSTIF